MKVVFRDKILESVREIESGLCALDDQRVWDDDETSALTVGIAHVRRGTRELREIAERAPAPPFTRDQLAAVEVILGKYLDDPDCAHWLAEEYGHGFVADADAARGVLKSMVATDDPCGTCDGAGCPVCRPTHTARRSPRPEGCEECPGCPDCLRVGETGCVRPEYHDGGCVVEPT